MVSGPTAAWAAVTAAPGAAASRSANGVAARPGGEWRTVTSSICGATVASIAAA